ncbi:MULTISPECIES: FMN-binding protein [Psychrilyobacter]|uniref:FMN-binding protein n=1 Tax=Psychrilyobacter piezotolerans TaxID=2293438 RepID=A0ABX9KI38_9FUSO|nr:MULTISPECIES: FMN-binding protein [Psychrilyobacter]MCS5422256.1 FMN-binding protein [Psychrilyobacter sp. S5]NDI77552.1 FMN-binding protein [Psychrilyobacter piezotolerans]RDE62937.1 FMN-binding protein [Psychrilyobacter sp. S5]REI41695.1 FMN-binding protein [Psychrilyobacter piezotolerans]
MEKNSMTYTAVFSFIITFILVFFLTLTHLGTKNRVSQYNRNYEISSILKAAGVQLTDQGVQEQFKSIFNLELPTNETMTAKIDGKDILVSKFSGKALWGTVNGIIAMDKNLKTIIGIDIISHNETPGLGGRIEEEWFLSQFKGEAVSKNNIKVIQGNGDGNYNSNDGIVDGIVGATRTSHSIEVMINQKIKSLREEAGNE